MSTCTRMTSDRGRALWRTLIVPATFAAMVATLAVGSVTGADTPGNTGTTGNTGSGSGSSAAVVTPLLDMFEFGDTVGLPLACSDAGSVVSIIGAQTQSSAATSPLVTQLDTQCAQLSSQG